MARVNLTANDIMSNKVVCINPNSSLVDVAKTMAKMRIGGVPVCDKKGKLTGIITERDIMNKVVAKGKDPRKVTVRQIMTSPPKVVARPHHDLSKLAKWMSNKDVSRIPVVDKNQLVGIVTNKDVAKHAPEVLDLLIERLDTSSGNAATAFGRCELCGVSDHLAFIKEQFVCPNCIQ